jgi:hypothetical protein
VRNKSLDEKLQFELFAPERHDMYLEVESEFWVPLDPAEYID